MPMWTNTWPRSASGYRDSSIEDASPEEMELLRAGMMAVTEVVKKSGPAPKGLQGSPDKPGSGQGTEHPL